MDQDRKFRIRQESLVHLVETFLQQTHLRLLLQVGVTSFLRRSALGSFLVHNGGRDLILLAYSERSRSAAGKGSWE
jgi:hypothetical protein